MNLREKLTALAEVIADEAERNSGFSERLAAALSDETVGNSPEKNSKRAQRARSRRPAPKVDPFEAYGKGEEALREALMGLKVEELKDIIAFYGFDRNRLAMRWKSKERLVDLITNRVASQTRKGNAFMEP